MGIDKPLEAVVKDTWNRDEYKATFEKEAAAEREVMKAQTELNTAIKEKNWDTVLAILDKQVEASDGAFGPSMRKFTILLVQMEQPDKAYAFGEEMAKKNWDEAMALNQLAWYVVDSPTVKTRDLDFAHKLANRANELTEGKDAAILDTFARVYYEKGDLKNAIRIQKKAVEFAPEGPMAEDIAAALKKYEEELAKKGG
jgi:tetratricopeptide (TPR) repeat protein